MDEISDILQFLINIVQILVIFMNILGGHDHYICLN